MYLSRICSCVVSAYGFTFLFSTVPACRRLSFDWLPLRWPSYYKPRSGAVLILSFRLQYSSFIVGIETELEGCMLWYKHDEQNLRGTARPRGNFRSECLDQRIQPEIKVSIHVIKYFVILWCLLVPFWVWFMLLASGVGQSDLYKILIRAQAQWKTPCRSTAANNMFQNMQMSSL